MADEPQERDALDEFEREFDKIRGILEAEDFPQPQAETAEPPQEEAEAPFEPSEMEQIAPESAEPVQLQQLESDISPLELEGLPAPEPSQVSEHLELPTPEDVQTAAPPDLVQPGEIETISAPGMEDLQDLEVTDHPGLAAIEAPPVTAPEGPGEAPPVRPVQVDRIPGAEQPEPAYGEARDIPEPPQPGLPEGMDLGEMQQIEMGDATVMRSQKVEAPDMIDLQEEERSPEGNQLADLDASVKQITQRLNSLTLSMTNIKNNYLGGGGDVHIPSG